MNDQAQKAERFRALHIPGRPLLLFNIWDAGSAKAVAASGATAIATSKLPCAPDRQLRADSGHIA